MAINAQELQGQWNLLKGKLKEKWGQLTEDDLHFAGGNFDHVIGKIQQKTGEGREAIERFFNTLTQGGASTVGHMTEKAHNLAGHAGDRLREGYSQASDYARDRYGMAEDVVRHNPGQSVAAAFGIGLVVGLVVGIAVRSR